MQFNQVNQNKGDVFNEPDAKPVLAHSASDADYINAMIRDLEDPDKRLVTEKLHDWRNYGVKGKAAILAALKEIVTMRRMAAEAGLLIEKPPQTSASDQATGQ